MISDQRIFFSDNGTLTDYSTALCDFRSLSVSLPFVAAEDYIYIGSFLPFNHKWVEVNTVNDQASSVTVDIWFQDSWKPAVDIIDETSLGGITLAQSGIVRWVTDRDYSWENEVDSFDVSGLETTEIYQMYWCRLGFSDNLNALTSLKYVGQKFANDIDLYSFYPDLNDSNIKLAFASGKTSWDEQHFQSARIIVSDLKRANIVISGSQVLEPDLFIDAGVHKCAEIIYGAMGKAYKDDLALARDRYKESININFLSVDRNRDGRLSLSERFTTTRLRR